MTLITTLTIPRLSQSYQKLGNSAFYQNTPILLSTRPKSSSSRRKFSLSSRQSSNSGTNASRSSTTKPDDLESKYPNHLIWHSTSRNANLAHSGPILEQVSDIFTFQGIRRVKTDGAFNNVTNLENVLNLKKTKEPKNTRKALKVAPPSIESPILTSTRKSSALYPKTTHSRTGDNKISKHTGACKMHSFIQFITTPTADTLGTALLLHFDDKRYLIGNIHEGTQRACIQRGTKLSKVSDIFLTGTTEWRNTGGLIGMVLTLADTVNLAKASVAEKALSKLKRDQSNNSESPMVPQEVEAKGNAEARLEKDNHLTVHGGPNLVHTVATARRFVFRKGLPIRINEHLEDGKKTGLGPNWTDEKLQIWTMPISPVNTGQGFTVSRSQSPRKRSFDEFSDVEDHVIPTMASQNESSKNMYIKGEEKKQETRRAVVASMFESAWRYDALQEVYLSQALNLTVHFVRNQETKKIERYAGPMPTTAEPLSDVKVLIRTAWPGALIEHLPSTTPSPIAMSYIIRNHRQRGKFLPSKAIALQVPKGPLFAELASGNDVLLEDGKTITPEMVLAEGKQGGGIAVVDLPSTHYVEGLVNRPEWTSAEVMDGVEAVIWILGPGVGSDECLSNFMQKFSHMKHIISSEDYCPNYLSMDSSASATIRLNQIDSTRYPLPIHDNTARLPVPQNDSEQGQKLDITPANRGLTIQLEPSVRIEPETSVPPLNTAVLLDEMSKEVLELARVAREELNSEQVRNETAEQNLPSPDAEIICLGTGSALPSKYRNVSGTLLRVPGYGSYLLDCGENTLGQLRRIFTPPELAEVLRDLKLIWISHLHADHHLGITSVIKAWSKENYGGENDTIKRSMNTSTKLLHDPAKMIREEKRLFVVGDSGITNWLHEYASVEDYGYDQLVPLAVYNSFPWLKWNDKPVGFETQDLIM